MNTQPTCTAIMPTRGRRVWANQALKCFLAQTYEQKDLIILDDEDNPSFPIPPKYPNVAHVLVKERMTIPEKRNMAARLATGSIIWHLDSDDWSAPNRMEEQVQLLTESRKAVVGYHSLIFHSAEIGSWYFRGYSGYPRGTSQCYLKSFWQSHPFKAPDPKSPNIAEDEELSRIARDYNEVVSLDAGLMMVARIHPDNTSPKNPPDREHQNWFRWTGGLPEGFTP